MKGSSFNTILNIILLIAVAVLFSMQFMDKDNTQEVADVDTRDTVETIKPEAVATIEADGKIVYVNTDTLLTLYKLSIDIKAKLKYKQEDLERQAEEERVKMEKELMIAQQMVRDKQMTQMQYETKAYEMQARAEKLQREYYDKGTRFEEYYSEQNNVLYRAVHDFLEEYRSRNGYTFIMQYSNNISALMAVDPSLDVTESVLTEMNARYEAEKAN
jgi:Skp family chaperone for outer membrane proteins